MNVKIKLINKRNYFGEEVANIYVESSTKLKSINCPKSLNTKTIDEFLLIFLICAKAKGISKFKGLSELRYKESDRLKIASNFLKMIGVKVNESFDKLSITGQPELNLKKNYVIKNFLKDHRVFMMTSIAALTLGGRFIIKDKDSINSSFPDFLSKLKQLGGIIK